MLFYHTSLSREFSQWVCRAKFQPLKVCLGVTLIGSGCVLVYLLTREYDLEFDEEPPQQNKRRRTFTEINISKEKVGHLIGRSGINIKEIQEKTATRITFKDEAVTDDFRVCVIRGLPSNVKKCEYMVRDFLAKYVVETVEMIIPPNTCGLIIGKSGNTIRGLQKSSGAKITIDSSECGVTGQKVSIKGTAEEIKKAKELIHIKLEEDGYGKFIAEQNRPVIPNQMQTTFGPACVETLELCSDFVEVFVSALESPKDFYVQLGSKKQELDKLKQEMIDFYGEEENQIIHEIKDPDLGTSVASQFNDGNWYRGTVVKTRNANSEEISIFYVDYGDVEKKKVSQTFSLIPKFQDLNHQAIHCSLEGVNPIGDTWSVEAIDLFESMTFDLENKMPLLAKLQGYCENTAGFLPRVILKSTDDKIIADELVARGFGKAANQTQHLPFMLPAGEEEDWNQVLE